MRRYVHPGLCASILLCGLASPSHAQQNAVAQGGSLPTLRLQSQLVILDVAVEDKNGNPITDLQQSDFQIIEAGVPQRIRSFDPPSAHTLPASLSTTGEITLQALQKQAPNTSVTVLVLDELNTAYSDQAYSRSQVKRYLEALPPTLIQPCILLAVTEQAVRQVHGFTLNRADLLQSLAAHKSAYPSQLVRTGNSLEGIAERFGESLASLQQVVQAMSGFHGRKNVVWIGPGFPSIDMRDMPETQRSRLIAASERTVNLLHDARVTLDTIDPRSASSSASDFTQTTDEQSLSESHNARNPFEGTISFSTFAPETGGRSFSLGNDINREIRQSVQEGSEFYTLTYVPSAPRDAAGNAYRELSIKVNRPGLRVITRGGYSPAVSPPVLSSRSEARQLRFTLGQAATSTLSYSAIAILAHAAPEPDTFTLQVETSGVFWEISADEQIAHFTLLAVALDKSNKPVAQSASEVTARLPADHPLRSVPFATLSAHLAVPPSATRIRFVVLDTESGKLGSVELVPRVP